MKLEDETSYIDVVVPSGVWTTIAYVDMDVYHNLGRACRVRYRFDAKTMTFMDGGQWSIRTHNPNRSLDEELQQEQRPSNSTSQGGSDGKTSSTEYTLGL